ncbi:hypothetical protein BJF88_10415 [Cellulosimicrobium sp. CUA-896]|nr:hypothetical protein BJF88_10415 [Cellulosimicrobium sp. CUA-896]
MCGANRPAYPTRRRPDGPDGAATSSGAGEDGGRGEKTAGSTPRGTTATSPRAPLSRTIRPASALQTDTPAAPRSAAASNHRKGHG